MDWCECCGMKCQWKVVQCGSGGGVVRDVSDLVVGCIIWWCTDV